MVADLNAAPLPYNSVTLNLFQGLNVKQVQHDAHA
jgi:hypothetical protein